jgi:predicted O-methyltransferase YrrM
MWVIIDKIIIKLFGFLAYRNFGNHYFSKTETNFVEDQETRFRNLGLNRDQGIVKLNDVLSKIYGKPYSERNGMWSEHLILFASISESTYKISNILEIGTFNGETARILSELFPHSEITTIDLVFEEILETKMYKYETNERKLVNSRIRNLESLPNVKFIEMNSLSLIEFTDSFDLIWVDGDHKYPIASIDIANAVRLLSPNGIGICDDVYTKDSKANVGGRSIASIETLMAMSKSKLIEYTLFQKRIGFYFNFPLINKKYLGFFKKYNYTSIVKSNNF